ncbi:MAG: hypothetical protein Q8R76_10580 [Candidatus Omnitrophota bacterium]|nr:hypothetical protein [Candidatus Omnitrophota bacterium]
MTKKLGAFAETVVDFFDDLIDQEGFFEEVKDVPRSKEFFHVMPPLVLPLKTVPLES